jgi:hypothetical protein
MLNMRNKTIDLMLRSILGFWRMLQLIKRFHPYLMILVLNKIKDSLGYVLQIKQNNRLT